MKRRHKRNKDKKRARLKIQEDAIANFTKLESGINIGTESGTDGGMEIGMEESVSLPPSIEIIPSVTFNPMQHRTQGGSRNLSDSDKIRYIKEEWSIVPLCSSCSKPSNVILTPIKQEISIEQLLINCLIKESKRSSENNFDTIPSNFYELVKNIIKSTNDQSTNDKEIWTEFGLWLGLKEPIKKEDVRKHLKLTRRRFNHAAEVRKIKNSEIPEEVLEINGKKSDAKKIEMINLAQNNNTKNFRFITNPECIVDKYDKTLVHLEELDDCKAVGIATKVLNEYYFHMVNNPAHRSKSFWENLAERFGALTTYSNLPYTTSDTASSHNLNHQDCVNNLLYAIQPISNSVNRFVKKYYNHYYMKLSKLSWGPFAPRSFGIFPTIAINFNAISNYHWDSSDDPNGLCFLVALGDFEGGELCFPQLQIVIKLKPGQIVVFPSCLLLHGNLPIIKGIRFSIVYFVHKSFFSSEKVLKNLEEKLDPSINNQPQDLYNAQDANPIRPSFNEPRNFQIIEPSENDATDKRRNQDGLKRARKGLRADEPL